MMKIKFRAWSKRRKTMHDWKYLLCSYSANSLFVQPKYFGLIMMQYTGLKDKNGKGIYEGDILRGKDYPFVCDGLENYLAVVYRSEHNGGFYSYPEVCSDRVRGCAAGDYVFDDGKDSAKEFEVIGNIHENADLLQNGGGS